MDSIEPLHHTPAQVSTKEGGLLPKNEYRHEHVIEMVAHIQKLCTYRAEETRVWADKLIFDEKTGLIDHINSDFDPKYAVVLKGELDSTIVSARRPHPGPQGLDRVLPAAVYYEAGLAAPSLLGRDEFEKGIRAIAKAYRQLHPRSAEVADEWATDALKAGKDVGGRFWDLLGKKSRAMRWRMIVVGERIRTGEKLPPVQDIVKGPVELPQNVSQSYPCFIQPHVAHALGRGRISIRQARRIGYEGPLAKDGGHDF